MNSLLFRFKKNLSRRLFVAQLLGSLATLSVQYFVLFKAHKAVDKANTLR